MADQAYLAIDLGAESGRAIVGILGDRSLQMEEVHRFSHLPTRLPTGLHWDLMHLWNNVREGVRCGVSWCDTRDVDLVSVGVDAWGVDYALLGASGELLMLPHAYRDERNAAAFDWAIAQIGSERIYDCTGIQFMAINTLYQLIAHRTVEPEVVSRAHDLVFIPDLMHFFLTGKVAVESTIASTSQMIDPRTGMWATGLIEQAGLPTSCLGDIVEPGTVLASLLPHVQKATGASDSVRVVVPTSHDTACAVAAVPADPSTSWCYVSSGTWSCLGAELDAPCLTTKAREASFTNEGGIGGTIRFLKNITGLWMVQECRRTLDQAGGTSTTYAELTELARASEPFRTFVDPAYPAFLQPGDMPEKIRTYARASGQPAPESSGQLVRCCLESLAMSYRLTLELMESVLDRTFEIMHIVGGGGQNDLLNEMTAHAIARPVLVGPFEATAMGNLLVQAMGTGAIVDRHELRRVVAAAVEPKQFVPGDVETWRTQYDRFQQIISG